MLDQICPKILFPVQSKTTENYPQIRYIWINLGTNFQLKETVLIFQSKFFAKSVFPVQGRTSEHYHWFQHIWISLGTNFSPKLTVLIFWTKYAQKGYSWFKTDIKIITDFKQKAELFNSSFANQCWLINNNSKIPTDSYLLSDLCLMLLLLIMALQKL